MLKTCSFDTNSMCCIADRPSEWLSATLIAWCLPGSIDALKILKPKTVIRWHRAGFRAYGHWRSRPHGGQHHVTSSVTETPSTATFSPAAFMRWAFVTGRLRHDRRGKTDMRSD